MTLRQSYTVHLAPHLMRLLPFLQWWPRVNRVTLRADALAGAIGAVVVLPQGIFHGTSCPFEIEPAAVVSPRVASTRARS